MVDLVCFICFIFKYNKLNVIIFRSNLLYLPIYIIFILRKPWWCNAAVKMCYSNKQDPCCVGMWANKQEACKQACNECDKTC